MRIKLTIAKTFEEEKDKEGNVWTPFCVEDLKIDRYNLKVFRFKGQIPKTQKTIIGDLYYWDGKLNLGRWTLE